MKAYLDALVNYAADCGLIEDEDRDYAFNRLLELMELDSAHGEGTITAPLHQILEALCDDACRRGVLDDNIVARDLFDTKLMGALTPFPHEVRRKFSELYSQSPESATDSHRNHCAGLGVGEGVMVVHELISAGYCDGLQLMVGEPAAEVAA